MEEDGSVNGISLPTQGAETLSPGTIDVSTVV